MGAETLAPGERNARRWRACLIFVDESGFSLIPPTRRTWARRGKPPIIRHPFSWPKLSAISGVTRDGRLYLQLVRGSIKSNEVIRFLKALMRHIRRRIIILWDNVGTHRSQLVKDWLRAHPRLWAERLPPYAYELNADEGVWEHLKGAPLGNYCATDGRDLGRRIRSCVRRLQRRKAVVRGFFRRTPLARV